jgi:hypothetical protein
VAIWQSRVISSTLNVYYTKDAIHALRRYCEQETVVAVAVDDSVIESFLRVLFYNLHTYHREVLSCATHNWLEREELDNFTACGDQLRDEWKIKSDNI